MVALIGSLSRSWLVLAVLLSVIGSSAVRAQTSTSDNPSEPAIAFASSAIGDEQRFRLWMDFDKPVSSKIFMLDNPRRLIIDLPEVVFSLSKDASKSNSPMIENIRFGSIAPGRSRVVLSLTQPVTIHRKSNKKSDKNDRHRVLVDLVAATEDEFLKAATEQTVEQSRGKVAWKGDRIERAVEDDSGFTIVIDPGHGGIDGGAVGKGKTVEKEVTLSFAKSLQKKLKGVAGLSVLLTRDDDVFVSLEERMKISRRNKADLLISIHADSLRQSRIRGATIYTLSREGTDELSRQLADKQNKADLIAGLDLPKVEDDVSDILIDLTRRETEVFSGYFAKTLVEKLQTNIKLIKNPHRGADFFVLRAAEVPSVLLELGYLSNTRDERLMRSTKWRNLATDRVVAAIKQFFDKRVAAQ